MFMITCLLCAMLCDNAIPVLVRVEQGLLKGKIRHRSTGNGDFYSFTGIPYAAPPVGKLRFMAPRPALSWKGERLATEHGLICPQAGLRIGNYIGGDEDCLFLNIYTPTIDLNASLSVMVYIHGGAFVSGSSREDRYGPDFLLDHNVIVVTINHRLGALGYLCLDTKEVPGNAGLKDQVEALRWVKRNIKQFGGDSTSVTIFGHSSGGSSVCLHTLSPMSNGLFKRAIIMGGSCFSGRAEAYEPKEHSLLLAHKIGLYTKDPHEVLDFLQNASVEAIVMSLPRGRRIDKLHDHLIKVKGFPPVVEKVFGDDHFMLENPEKMLLEGKTNDVELVLGYAAEEGTGAAIMELENILGTFPYFKEMLVPPKLFPIISQAKILKLADRIKKRYFGDKKISKANFKEFINFYTYYLYVYDLYKFLEMWTNFGKAKIFFYIFHCFSERNVFGKTGIQYGVKKATHVDELLYLFDWKKSNLTLDKNSSSYEMIVKTCNLFTNFAKYGNPKPNQSLGVIWPNYRNNQSLLNIDLKLTVGPVPSEEIGEINFWHSIYNDAKNNSFV